MSYGGLLVVVQRFVFSFFISLTLQYRMWWEANGRLIHLLLGHNNAIVYRF